MRSTAYAGCSLLWLLPLSACRRCRTPGVRRHRLPPQPRAACSTVHLTSQSQRPRCLDRALAPARSGDGRPRRRFAARARRVTRRLQVAAAPCFKEEGFRIESLHTREVEGVEYALVAGELGYVVARVRMCSGTCACWLRRGVAPLLRWSVCFGRCLCARAASYRRAPPHSTRPRAISCSPHALLRSYCTCNVYSSLTGFCVENGSGNIQVKLLLLLPLALHNSRLTPIFAADGHGRPARRKGI